MFHFKCTDENNVINGKGESKQVHLTRKAKMFCNKMQR